MFKYNWTITEIRDDYYIKGNAKVVFNGELG